MREVLSREQIQRFDRSATTSGVPSLLLMENAGRGAADWLAAHPAWLRARVLVLAGPGNNGGDGWVVARRLLAAGHVVEVASSVEPSALKGDARQMFLAYAACGGNWSLLAARINDLSSGACTAYSLLVDALWGTGLTRGLDAAACEWIEKINNCGATCGVSTVALDLPSGLDANTGALYGACVRAQATLTFAYLKTGLLTPNGREYGGKSQVINIGVPPNRSWWQPASDAEPETALNAVGGTEPAALSLETADVVGWLKQRGTPRHKGEAGRVLVVAGSPGATGAARLCAHAAQRAGAGLVTLAARPDVAEELGRDLWEAMLCRLSHSALEASLQTALTSAKCVALGPGLGLDELGARLVKHVVASFAGPLLMDADALTHYAGNVRALQSAPGQLLLTPHPAEAARLLGIDTREVEANRFHAVKQLAERSGASVLLKGPCTLLCSPGGTPWVVDRGAPVLATAGSGDVLAGIAVALACHLPPLPALASAAWIHACAGEREGELRPLGVLARELADRVPEVMADLVRVCT